MTKPKDRTSQFKRQHKRILEERTELLATLENYDRQKVLDIEAAVTPVRVELAAVRVELDQEVARSSRYGASNRILERDLDCVRGRAEGIAHVLELERAERVEELAAARREWAAEKAELEARLAAVAPDLARLDALVARWEGRAKKAELEEANAILNRQVLAGAAPGINRRS